MGFRRGSRSLREAPTGKRRELGEAAWVSGAFFLSERIFLTRSEDSTKIFFFTRKRRTSACGYGTGAGIFGTIRPSRRCTTEASSPKSRNTCESQRHIFWRKISAVVSAIISCNSEQADTIKLRTVPITQRFLQHLFHFRIRLWRLDDEINEQVAAVRGEHGLPGAEMRHAFPRNPQMIFQIESGRDLCGYFLAFNRRQFNALARQEIKNIELVPHDKIVPLTRENRMPRDAHTHIKIARRARPARPPRPYPSL